MKNILFVLTRSPFPAIDGTRERIIGEIKYISARADLDLLLITDEKITKNQITKLKEFGIKNLNVFNIKEFECIKNSLLAVANKRPIQSSYFLNKSAVKFLNQNCQKYDKIFFHTIRFGEYIKALKNDYAPKILLGYNDAISMNYKDAYKKASGLWRIVYWLESKRLADYEIDILKLVDGASIISSRDLRFIEDNWINKYGNNKIPSIKIIRNIIDDEIFDNQYQPEEKGLVFMGNLFYPPNRFGLKTFCKKIWPLIKKEIKEAKFIIIGRGGKEYFSRFSGLDVRGFVESPYSEITRQAIFISPADFGAGVPTKTLTAMAMGMPVVSTQNNALGIDGISDMNNICLIDYKNYEKSAKKIINLLLDQERRTIIGNNGKKLVTEKYKKSTNSQELEDFIIG